MALRVFDAWSCSARRFVEIDHLCVMANRLQVLTLPPAPLIYRGTIAYMSTGLAAMAEGPTLLGGRHVREGVVVKTADGRFRGKWVGEGYKMRKNQEDATDE